MAATLPEQREPSVVQLAAAVAQYINDPLGFVRFAYPWGEGPLRNASGPYEWQCEVLDFIGHELRAGRTPVRVAIASGHGIGKAHPLDAMVPTPMGMRRWGTIEPGDRLFGVDGAPVQVRATRRYGSIPMRRVWFDDGSHVDASTGHLWRVQGRQDRRDGKDRWRTLETIQIEEAGVQRANGAAKARQWKLPAQGAVHFNGREVPIHPYVVGVWLGDGSINKPAFTKPCPEIVERIKGLGYDVRSDEDRSQHYIRGICRAMKEPPFICGSHERFIPADYLFNDVASRMELFQGLCDTDGEVHNSHSIGYSTTSERLADQVVWLARSLGCKAMLQPTAKRGAYRNASGDLVDCRDCYRVTINAPFNPFSVPHKRDRWKLSEDRYRCRWIDRIEPLGDMPGMCVEVSGGLYQAPSFVVTHNSALIAWLIQWGIGTRPRTVGTATANTEAQLKSKTWSQVTRWHALWALRMLFDCPATAIFAKESPRDWRINAIPWSENRPESIAGQHNQDGRSLFLMDEASAIPLPIWDAVHGALTDERGEIIWVAFGNPTRTDGPFRERFPGGLVQHRGWKTWQIDARDVPGTNKALFREWEDEYGEDSDFFRVRVRGQFPRASVETFISLDLVLDAQKREAQHHKGEPLIMGVDPGRGVSESVIAFRRGQDARSIPWIIESQRDPMRLAAAIAGAMEQHKPDAVFVDEGDIGGGVIARLNQLRMPVWRVNFAWASDAASLAGTEAFGERYGNKRSEMWGAMRAWLAGGGAIPADRTLGHQITNVLKYEDLRQRILLEKKSDMAKRGLPSPDRADALALTFAYPVGSRPLAVDEQVMQHAAAAAAPELQTGYAALRARAMGAANIQTEHDPYEGM